MVVPRVSVILPAYNAARFIGPTIESIRNQTLTDLELIVVDDGSTDETTEIVRRTDDPRIHCFRRENAGQSAARNFGLRQARGRYFAYCDHDDLFRPDHLRELVGYLDANPAVGLVYSKELVVKGDGQVMGERGKPFNRRQLELYNCISSPSAEMHRRECFDRGVLWDESPELRYGSESWDFNLRVADLFPIGFFDKVTLNWVRHRGTWVHQTLMHHQKEHFAGRFYVIKKRLHKFAAQPRGDKIAPFDGYYFGLFQRIRFGVQDAVLLGGEFKEITKAIIVPAFAELIEYDPSNFELFLLLALLYFMQSDNAQAVAMARRAAAYLDQPFEPEQEFRAAIIPALTGIARELANSGEKDLARGFIEKSRELA